MLIYSFLIGPDVLGYLAPRGPARVFIIIFLVHLSELAQQNLFIIYFYSSIFKISIMIYSKVFIYLFVSFLLINIQSKQRE